MDTRYHHPQLGYSPTKPLPHPHFNFAKDSSVAKEDLGPVQVLNSKEKFIVKLDTRGYTPDELEVKTLDGFLIICGESEETGREEFRTSRSFRRRFLLPDNCKEEELVCELGGMYDDDTILKVVLPRNVPDQMGKVHSIVGSGKNRTHSHSAYPLHQGQNNGHGHPVGNGYWVSGVECNRDRFLLRLEMPRFSPDEITVKTVDDFLVVEGNQEEKDAGTGHGDLVSCSFRRRYLLPVNADLEGVDCAIYEEGRLKVVVPRINLDKTEHEKIYKVERK